MLDSFLLMVSGCLFRLMQLNNSILHLPLAAQQITIAVKRLIGKMQSFSRKIKQFSQIDDDMTQIIT